MSPTEPVLPASAQPDDSNQVGVPATTPALVAPVLSPAEEHMRQVARRQLARRARTFDRWMVLLVVLTLGGSCLLISAGQGTKDGMRPWSPNSILHVVVDTLNFNGAYPTPRGVAVKWLAQGLGAAAALLLAGIAWYWRRPEDEARAWGNSGSAPAGVKPFSALGRIQPVSAAQIALAAFGVWAMLSSNWSHFAAGSLGEGTRTFIVVLWAIALGRTLTANGAIRAAAGMVGVLVVTAVLGLWYYAERNPVMRLEFPIGNPIFFAACMVPALAMSLAGLLGSIATLAKGGRGAQADRASVPGKNVAASLAIASLVALAVVLWAFKLADSRAPAVALAAGIYAAAVAWIARVVHPSKRRLVVVGGIALVMAVYVFVGRPWLAAQQARDTGGRGASLRLRYYTWQYAENMFFSKPLSGHGQGAYVLLSQGMAYGEPRDQWNRTDVERDPAVFNGNLVGHAHNEWLEILADLGAVGFALMATSLGLTFWVGLRTYMRTTSVAQRWCMLGLLVSLLAIIVEECADVALRMAGLPLVFFTVVGLIWALSRDPREHAAGVSVWPDRLRPIGFVAVLLGAVMIVSVVRRDFSGAVADGKANDYLQKQQWDQALTAAAFAGRNRLVMEDIISAGRQEVTASYAAAASRFQQFRSMLGRQESEAAAQRANIRALAEEDVTYFDRYANFCMQAGQRMQTIMPGIDEIPEWMGQVLMMKAEIEARKSQIGLQPDKQPFLAAARQCFADAYGRNRFSADLALRLLSLMPGQPIEQRIELLRLPLREGALPTGMDPNMQAALAQMLQQEANSFTNRMNYLLTQAEQALAQPDPDRWSDPYAPETLRLQATAAQLSGDFAKAIALTAQAVKLYEAGLIRSHYPSALSRGLAQQAAYQFMSDPGKPGQAVELMRKAIDAWPQVGGRDDQLKPLRREISLYMVAAGDMDGASRLIREQAGALTPDQINHNIGYGLAELCQRFIARPPADRPSAFGGWLNKSIELAPDWPATRWMSAQVALEAGHGEEAVKHLQVVQASIDDPDQFEAMVQSLADHFPDSAPLKAFMQSAAVQQTQPASGPAPVTRFFDDSPRSNASPRSASSHPTAAIPLPSRRPEKPEHAN